MTQMTQTVNYYEILEIPSDADAREIKRAYHRLARDLHPDKASSPEEGKMFEERFASVSQAYNTLKDSAKRDEHNKLVGAKSPSAGKVSTATSAVLSAGRGVPQADAKGSQHTTEAGAPPKMMVGLTPEKISIAQKAYARGMQCMKEGNSRKAIDFFEAAIQNNDTEAIYFSKLSMALIQARKSATRAIDLAQKAIALDPYNAEHKFTLAFIYETIGSVSNARKIYEDVLRWDTGNKQASLCLDSLKKKKSGFSLNLGGGASGGPNFIQKFLAQLRKK